jgi:hypothetical protein
MWIVTKHFIKYFLRILKTALIQIHGWRTPQVTDDKNKGHTALML